MTDKEKAIVMAHTGICMLTGNKFQIFHKYIEDIMNRPIMTHEIGQLADEIKEKSKADFMALCADENSSENSNNSTTTKNDLGVICIDKQATLDAIIKRLGISNESYLLPAEKTIYQQIQDMPPATPQEPRWIPVSERLPEKNMSCLVSVGEFHFTEIAMYSDLMGTIDHKIFWQGHYGKDNSINITKCVCAWMPLPKDYREEKVQNAKEVEEEK